MIEIEGTTPTEVLIGLAKKDLKAAYDEAVKEVESTPTKDGKKKIRKRTDQHRRAKRAFDMLKTISDNGNMAEVMGRARKRFHIADSRVRDNRTTSYGIILYFDGDGLCIADDMQYSRGVNFEMEGVPKPKLAPSGYVSKRWGENSNDNIVAELARLSPKIIRKRFMSILEQNKNRPH